MKKLLAVILSLIMILCLAACGTQTEEESANNNTSKTSNKTDTTSSTDEDDTQNSEDKGKKIDGEIMAASTFSEGLAFVYSTTGGGKTSCINKDGYVVFELDMDLKHLGKIYAEFVNGYAMLNQHAQTGRVLCDTKGNLTTPEDLGVTDFSGIALEGGYIIVEKVTSTYDSTKKELGVMNTDFEWVIELSESLYDQLGGVMVQPVHTSSFYYNDICYFEDCKKYLNLKTGEVTDSIDIVLPSDKWQGYTDGTYRDYNGNVVLDLSDNPNVEGYTYGANFVNGKLPLRFHNKESNTYFFTLVNEKGEFLFDPIELSKIEAFGFDGEYLLVIDHLTYSDKTIKCYNTSGELLGEISSENFNNPIGNIEINDGVILLTTSYNNSMHRNYYYNPDFTELF